MSGKTGIEWTRGDDGTAGATWNPVTGCEKVSSGCDRCYAETFAERWRGTPGHHFERGFDVQLRPDKLRLPLTWRKPKKIFTNSMSDLFHRDVPDDYIAMVFAVMALAPRHTFQVLTKRHARMRSLLSDAGFQGLVRGFATMPGKLPTAASPRNLGQWPLPNVHLGVSAESQHWLDTRLPALLATPAAVRWVSAEPLLGPLSFWPDDHAGHDRDDTGEFPHGYTCLSCSGPEDEAPRVEWTTQDHWTGVDWVVAGGESGPGARRCELSWLRQLRDQCAETGTPFFCKQLGAVAGRELGAGPKGGGFDAWPEDLKIREWPSASVHVG